MLLSVLLIIGCDEKVEDGVILSADSGLDEDLLGDGGQEGEDEGDTGGDTGDTGGTGAAGDIEFSDEAVSFGTVYVGCSVTHSLQIRNAGKSDLTISGVTLSTGSTDLTLTEPSGLPWTLSAGTSTTVDVVYAPLDEFKDTGYLFVQSDSKTTPEKLAVFDGSGQEYASRKDQHIADGSDTYTLVYTPVAATAEVSIDSVRLTEGWSISGKTLTFDKDHVPESQSVIEVEYIESTSC